MLLKKLTQGFTLHDLHNGHLSRATKAISRLSVSLKQLVILRVFVIYVMIKSNHCSQNIMKIVEHTYMPFISNLVKRVESEQKERGRCATSI